MMNNNDDVKKNCLRKIIGVLFVIVYSINTYAQLDSEHYLPPLKQVINNQAIKEQAVYFSTPETTAFSIEIYRGNSATPLTTITGLKKGSSKVFDSSNGLADGDNNITLVTNANTGKVLTNSGLRIVAPGGQKFYVNYRGRSSAQAGSLTSKGAKAKGTEFRWGGIPNRADNVNLTTSLGMMATEDGTVVTVSGYDLNCVFRKANNESGITDDSLTIELDKGESFVLEAVKNAAAANSDGWLGAKLVATKPIVISNGGLNVGIRPGAQSRDVGIDQPVDVSSLGREYVFVRANGTNETEFPIIVGTQNGTAVYAGGNLVGTINDGEYLEIPGSYYSSGSAGASMYVTTSKEAYAYQCLQGAEGSGKIQTIGMNFIAPVNCLLPSVLDEIPDIDRIAGSATNISAITIIASSITPNANIIVKQNGNVVTLPAPVFPTGTSDWKTFYVTGLEGEIDITSSGPIAVGTFMSLGANAGLAGYFSGFDTVPVVGVKVTGGGCFPTGVLEEETGNFDAYQWYKNGVIVVGETASTYTPNSIGDYYVVVTEGTCSYSSPIVTVYNCDPDIVVKKTADKSTVTDGDTIEFTVTVQSFGKDPVTNLVITDVFPPQLNLVSVNQGVGTWNAPNWEVGTLNAGELKTIKFVGEVPNKPEEGSFINIVSNTQDQVDKNLSADDLSESFTITAKKIDLRLIKEVDKSVVKIGNEITFTLTLKNYGPQGATGVQVEDKLPAGLTFSSSVLAANTTYTPGTGIWDLSGRTIASGESILLKIKAIANTKNIQLNTAEIIKTEQKDVNSTPNNGN
ncbi:DUF11 domain-containing protein [Polaribacter sp. MSW13]|uniref:DUF11 domain-containing protein n=1 Tax=Polaribacter marinus TaxID=2916838 RepID=A0A9X1VP97_9FLAO|nr:DUF11 domain-containing protein [Polaribacter marinus]MCI2230254.1 DUF11 domain-containing protein [Polaribacter marinus]